MRRLLFTLLMGILMIFNANAQTVIETSKPLDNTYVTVQGGVATPLALDAVFPVNPVATIAVGKWITPAVGFEIEGSAWFGSHYTGGTASRFDYSPHNAIRGSYVGMNGKVNWSNLLLGYKGQPRRFDVGTTTGIGWAHGFRAYQSDANNNFLGAKTGLDLNWNLGKTYAHTLTLQPAVLWNLSQPGNRFEELAFNKKGAQLYVGVGYTYHFKTSNGTRHFKTYDLGKLRMENRRLKEALAKKPKEVVKYVEKKVEVQMPQTSLKYTEPVQLVVFFAQGSADLSTVAQATLESINTQHEVEVTATASPEGTAKFNQDLSQRRANVVKEYLEKRGVKVTRAEGLGVTGKESNRVAIVIVK